MVGRTKRSYAVQLGDNEPQTTVCRIKLYARNTRRAYTTQQANAHTQSNALDLNKIDGSPRRSVLL